STRDCTCSPRRPADTPACADTSPPADCRAGILEDYRPRHSPASFPGRKRRRTPRDAFPVRIRPWPVRRPSAISRSAWFVSSAVDLVYAHADELGHELVVAEMVGRDLAGHAALLDDQHAIRQAANEIEVLVDQHDGEPPLPLEAEQDARDLLDDRGLDAFGRLVEQDEL